MGTCSAKEDKAPCSEKKPNDDLDRIEAHNSEICGPPTTLCLSLHSGATRDVIVGLDTSVGQLQRKMARELLKRAPEVSCACLISHRSSAAFPTKQRP